MCTSISMQEYINTRLDDQINWYDKKSTNAQNWFKRLKYVEIILSLLTTLLGAYTAIVLFIIDLPTDTFPVTIGVLTGISGAILSGIHFSQSLEKYHENWISYRQTCELLKHEKYLFLTRSGGYSNNQNAFNNLVERCESIISSENIDWAQLHQQERIQNTQSHNNQ